MQTGKQTLGKRKEENKHTWAKSRHLPRPGFKSWLKLQMSCHGFSLCLPPLAYLNSTPGSCTCVKQWLTLGCSEGLRHMEAWDWNSQVWKLKTEASWPYSVGQNTRGAANQIWSMWQSYLNLSEHLLLCEATSPSLTLALSPHLPPKKAKTMWTNVGTPRKATDIS